MAWGTNDAVVKAAPTPGASTGPHPPADSEPPKAHRLRSLKAMVRHTMIVSVFALITQNTYI